MSYPWLREPWLQVVNSAQQQRLAHAYYMQHAPQRGSEQFLLTLAQFILCRQPAKSACGQCKSCLLFKAGTHPDLWQIEAGEGTRIGIDQVRQLQQQATQTANQGGARVAIIRPADKLTEQAANAILKILEEPPEDLFWLLAVEQAAHLLPTLKSRLQWINLQLPALASDDEQDAQAASLLSALRGEALVPVMKNKDQAEAWLNITEQLLEDLLKSSQRIAAQYYHFSGLQEQYRQLNQQQHVNQRLLSQAVAECRHLRQKFHYSKGLNLPLLLSLNWQQWATYVFSSGLDAENTQCFL
ncbi:DNA polymerase III subunit delta' [Idiomarina seosinensis]|uniref:DNA polymerase III subunit delta' n=1 Tax=Idiomarina seosinensis TaxID=281739 RepID=UPI00384DA5CF